MAILPKRTIPLGGVQSPDSPPPGEAPAPNLLGDFASRPEGGASPPSDPKLPIEEFQLPQTLVMYGETGTRKTTEIGGLVEYVYEKWGLPSRMVTVEPNYSHIMKYVRAGILEVYPVMENFRSPLALLRALSQGAWMPSITKGEKTYLTPAGPKRDFVDPCGNKISQPTLQRPVGAYFFEGISSTASLLLRTVTNAGRKIGEGVVGQFSEESYLEGKSDELYAASAMAHYGFVQNQIQDLLVAFCSLPVKMVAFTAHEGRGVDNITKAPLHGPQVVGKAGTSTIAPKVGDLFHMDSVLATRDSSGAIVKLESVRAYFQKHSDPDNSSILWPAKPRWPKDQISVLQQKWPEGFIDLNTNTIADYFRLRDEVESQAADETKRWKENIDRKRTEALRPQPQSTKEEEKI